VFRHALDIVRVVEKPLTAQEITDRMLTAKGIVNPDQKAVRDLMGCQFVPSESQGEYG
jgi:hypothetical protein